MNNFILKEETYQEMLWFISGLWSNVIVRQNPSFIIKEKLIEVMIGL